MNKYETATQQHAVKINAMQTISRSMNAPFDFFIKMSVIGFEVLESFLNEPAILIVV